MTPLELTGRSRSHVRQYETPRFAASPEAAEAFLEMANHAKVDGFELFPFSAFRDFKSQSRIWDMKFTAKRPLLDQSGSPIEPSRLSDIEKVTTILKWTALPGASRHHWGSEIDVVDGATVANGYHVQLTPEETREGGVFYEMNRWLSENMARYGFFRPYAKDLGGVYPEPWHLSYAPISRHALQRLTLDLLVETINNSQLQGKNTILDMLPTLYHQYVLNISDDRISDEMV